MALTALSLLACTLTMAASLLLALGRVRAVYALGIVNGSLYAALNILLSLREGQGGVAWLAVPSVWGAAMSGWGLIRTRRKIPP